MLCAPLLAQTAADHSVCGSKRLPHSGSRVPGPRQLRLSESRVSGPRGDPDNSILLVGPKVQGKEELQPERMGLRTKRYPRQLELARWSQGFSTQR